MMTKSSYRRRRLAPRCRLITSSGCSRSEGLDCSSIKVVRELGSERRKTVRSISDVGARALRGVFHSTRGPVKNVPMMYQFSLQRETLGSYALSE